MISNLWNPMAQANPQSFMNPSGIFNSGQAGMAGKGAYTEYPFGQLSPYYNPDPYQGIFSKMLKPFQEMRQRYQDNPDQDTLNTVAKIQKPQEQAPAKKATDDVAGTW